MHVLAFGHNLMWDVNHTLKSKLAFDLKLSLIFILA